MTACLQLDTFASPYTPTVVLQLHAGIIAALHGPSGCGKSALCRAIVELDPSHGDCQLDGRKREAFSSPGWRQRCAYLPAESAWWDRTVGDHFVTLPNATELADLALRPDILTASPEDCSSGERERLAVLRQLQRQPRVLLLDELGAHCDPDARQRLAQQIRHYTEQQPAAVLWISHDANLRQQVASRHLLMNQSGIHDVDP
jgi:putative ABC transport system ATP-binding protein